MPRLLAILLLAVLLTACNQGPATPPVAAKPDTLVIVRRDTVVVIQQAPTTPVAATVKAADTLPAQPARKVPAPKPTKPITEAKPAADTTYYYYSNKKVSVKITPWVNGERWVLLYNLYGYETYRQQEVRHSYSISARLQFHPNGAVSQMLVSNNPGASRYWYETTITFSTTNDPEQRKAGRKPYEDLSDAIQPWEYWDAKAKQWRKQETME